MLSSRFCSSSRLSLSSPTSAPSAVSSNVSAGRILHRISFSALESVLSNSRSASSNSRSPRRSAPDFWWEHYIGYVNAKGAFQDVRIKSTPIVTAEDLSFLRPPPIPFVLPPQPDRNGRISLFRRIGHWWETVRTEYTFYEQALARYKENRKEYEIFRMGFHQRWWPNVEYAALYGGTAGVDPAISHITR